MQDLNYTNKNLNKMKNDELTTYYFIEANTFEGFVNMLIAKKEVINVKILDVETQCMGIKSIKMEFESVLDAIYLGMNYQKFCLSNMQPDEG
jgi:hypothetical protein